MTRDERRSARLIREGVRFVLVGCANTLAYYLVYLTALIGLPYYVAHLIAWPISGLVAFLLNCRFTWRVRPTLGRLVRYPLAMLANFVTVTVATVVLVEVVGVNARLAPLVAAILAIPVTFLVARWVLTHSSTAVLDPHGR